jgi:diaminopimelate epimerase
MAAVAFTKMQGTGNDFIVVDARDSDPDRVIRNARFLCDRKFGIGADQLLLIRSSRQADFKMQIFNADGSEVEMCGNGIRCFAKYLKDRGLTDKATIQVETPAGIMTPTIRGELVSVDMGEPILDGPAIPVKLEGRVIAKPIRVGQQTYTMTCVSMGNPHCVIRVEDVNSFPAKEVGSAIESHPLFPNRVNVEFVEILSDREIRMRVWERGSGETLSCGTGACAAVVASSLNEWTGREAQVHLAGGDLEIRWESNNRVTLTGPGKKVFSGAIELSP